MTCERDENQSTDENAGAAMATRLAAAGSRMVAVGRPPVIEGPGLADVEVVQVVEDTAVGRLLLAARADGALLACLYTPDDAAVAAGLQRIARVVSPRILGLDRVAGGDARRAIEVGRRQLADYLEGRRRDFDLPFDLVLATPFQHQVLTALPSAVGYGARASYRELAAWLGRPTASRAVGTALGANPLCVVLPCHRVVGASGALTGYAGGVEAKRWLLDLEQRAA